VLGEEIPRAVLADWRRAPLDRRLRAMLGFLEKLTLTPDDVGTDDARELFRAGVSAGAARDAIYVAFQFAFLARMADALGFAIPNDAYRLAPKVLLSPIGYR
jgi:alkylhydroperoxidase family enzyme